MSGVEPSGLPGVSSRRRGPARWREVRLAATPRKRAAVHVNLERRKTLTPQPLLGPVVA